MFPKRLEARGVMDREAFPLYPYRDDGLAIWSALQDWVKAYIQLNYDSDQAVVQDEALQNWAKELVALNGGKVKQFGNDGQGSVTTRDYLIEALTLIIFTGDNGTGVGIKSEMGKVIIPGMKGSTNQYGTHVPLIAFWAGHIKPGQVNDNLVDFSDFLPTITDAAGITLPPSFITDGMSFYPQLKGDFSKTREWIFCHFDPQNGEKYEQKRFVQNRDWKLYESGEFYDMHKDPYEKKPIAENALTAEVKVIKQQFQEVFGRMKVEETKK